MVLTVYFFLGSLDRVGKTFLEGTAHYSSNYKQAVILIKGNRLTILIRDLFFIPFFLLISLC